MFDDVVGIVEIINSRDVKVQVSACDLFSAWSMTAALYNRVSVASAALSSVFPEQECASVENIHEMPSVLLLCSSPCPALGKGLKFASLKLHFRALDKRLVSVRRPAVESTLIPVLVSDLGWSICPAFTVVLL